MGLISFFVSVVCFIFWLFMLLEMIKNKRIQESDKVFWLLGFIFLSLLTAGFYYFTQYRRR